MAAKMSTIVGDVNNNNNELYLHDTSFSVYILLLMFRNQNYNTGQLQGIISIMERDWNVE